MAKQPINNGKVVERSYEDYRNNQYLVNRRYQRKLVWELEEKQAFIDSLANVNSTPFVRQYDILFNKWGVLLCQKEYQTNDIRRNSREWL